MYKKVKIVADDKIPFLKGALKPFALVEYYPGEQTNNELLRDVDALITRTRTKCNARLLENTNVKIITTATIGFDHIDTRYCEEKGIRWYNAPGCNSSSVHQYIASVLVNLAHKNNFKLSGQTIGIVGVGNVGTKVAKLAGALGMKVLLNDPPRARLEGEEKFVSLGQIKNECDIITFHVPLNKTGEYKTLHMADCNFFSKLKRKPIIINSSRGEVVETNALKDAFRNNVIAGAVLDVWENEPNLDLELFDMVDIATPHIAGYSVDGKANGTAACVRKIAEHFNLDVEPDWFPQNLPTGEKPLAFEIDCLNKCRYEILFEVINYTYNVWEDDKRLRANLKGFEKQRNEYPPRREFANYHIELINPQKEITEILSGLGFVVS